MIEQGRIRSAARIALCQGAHALLDELPPHGEHGAVLAERLRFGPPETWMGWRRGSGKVAVKIWPEPQPSTAAVIHGGIAPLLAAGPCWRVLGWIEGHTLNRHLSLALPLDAEAIIAAIGESLAALHAAGLSHGDLTPANVIITQDRRPVLIDWGESTAGTPGWCPGPPHDDLERDRYALAKLAALLLSGDRTATSRP